MHTPPNMPPLPHMVHELSSPVCVSAAAQASWWQEANTPNKNKPLCSDPSFLRQQQTQLGSSWLQPQCRAWSPPEPLKSSSSPQDSAVLQRKLFPRCVLLVLMLHIQQSWSLPRSCAQLYPPGQQAAPKLGVDPNLLCPSSPRAACGVSCFVPASSRPSLEGWSSPGSGSPSLGSTGRALGHPEVRPACSSEPPARVGLAQGEPGPPGSFLPDCGAKPRDVARSWRGCQSQGDKGALPRCAEWSSAKVGSAPCGLRCAGLQHPRVAAGTLRGLCSAPVPPLLLPGAWAEEEADDHSCARQHWCRGCSASLLAVLGLPARALPPRLRNPHRKGTFAPPPFPRCRRLSPPRQAATIQLLQSCSATSCCFFWALGQKQQ
ncbi:uncharacterized protein LOC135190065 [Pogoniulus pusillus]|uniref:uncharacterized protein LOC135190065 n=1 Tax=Pogoniulus pusillus TaxID=488313 RepID=UPI0030B98261